MNQSARTLTDKELSGYLVYRIKLNELIHLNFLYLSLKEGACGNSVRGIQAATVSGTIRTAALAWFVTLVDGSGLDVFKLWEKLFPQYRKRIALYRSVVLPQLDVLRKFRNKTAFHAEPKFVEFYKPRIEIMKHSEDISNSLRHFLHLAKFLIAREHKVDRHLQSRVLGVILNAELELDCHIRREWLIETNIIDRSTIYGTWRETAY